MSASSMVVVGVCGDGQYAGLHDFENLCKSFQIHSTAEMIHIQVAEDTTEQAAQPQKHKKSINVSISSLTKNLKKGTELTKSDWSLLDACRNGDIEKVYSSLWDGANPNCKEPIYNTTPLVIAARQGFKNIAPVLVEFSAEILTADSYGATIFHWVANSNQLALFEYLHDRFKLMYPKNADMHRALNVKDEFGSTALHFAAVRGHQEMCQMLLEAGSDPTILNNDGKRASECSDDLSIKALLQEVEGSFVKVPIKKEKEKGKKGNKRDAVARKTLNGVSDTKIKTGKNIPTKFDSASKTGNPKKTITNAILRKSSQDLAKNALTKRSSTDLNIPKLAIP